MSVPFLAPWVLKSLWMEERREAWLRCSAPELGAVPCSLLPGHVLYSRLPLGSNNPGFVSQACKVRASARPGLPREHSEPAVVPGQGLRSPEASR